MRICGKDALIEGAVIRIARLDAEGYDFLESPEAGLDFIRKSKVKADLFTFIQPLSDTSPKYPYPMTWDNMAALRITTLDHWLKGQIDFKARNKARKASKNGVIVREVDFSEELVKGISDIYNEVPVRQGRAFWHYGKDLEAVRRMNATFMDRSVFIGAFFEEKLIGFVKLVTNEDASQGGLMQIVSMIRHRDKAPNNALIAQAVKSCAERGIAHLWYANFSYGKKREDSLAEFKRHNGFEKIDVPRYYIPLTRLGKLGYQLGLHRKTVEWVPEPLTKTYRWIRGHWYARRYAGFENV
jgi:hypothetical protein